MIASAEAVGLAELGDTGSESAALVVANGVAMETAVALADHLDGDAILAMHKALLGSTEPESAGKWRTVQNWIGGSGSSPHEAMFVPPQPDRVPAAIHDLERFLARDDLPVLVQAAIAHAQFETIHPFTDGNGRTGRALVHSLLRAKELTRHVTVPVSAGLLADTRRYFEALTAYRDGDPEPIVERLANASFAAINNGRALVDELHTVRASWDEAISARRGATRVAPRRHAPEPTRRRLTARAAPTRRDRSSRAGRHRATCRGRCSRQGLGPPALPALQRAARARSPGRVRRPSRPPRWLLAADEVIRSMKTSRQLPSLRRH